jgi:hypothetical protein
MEKIKGRGSALLGENKERSDGRASGAKPLRLFFGLSL